MAAASTPCAQHLLRCRVGVYRQNLQTGGIPWWGPSTCHSSLEHPDTFLILLLFPTPEEEVI